MIFERFKRQPVTFERDPGAIVSPLEDDKPVAIEEKTQVSAQEFMELHSGDLQTSSELWRKSIASLSSLQEDKYQQHFEAAVDGVLKNKDYVASPATRRKMVRELTGDCAFFLFTLSRACSSEGVKALEIPMRIKKQLELIDGENHTVNILLNGSRVSNAMLGKDIGKRATDIQEADRRAESVLGSFTQQISIDNDFIGQISEIFDDGAGEVEPLYKELKEMIAVDWHRPDPDKSILRRFCKEIADKPEFHFQAFVRSVENPGDDKRLNIVNSMARFATLHFAKEKKRKSSIADILADSYNDWSEFPEIEEAYNCFCKLRATDIESKISAIASTKPSAFRAHRTSNDVKNARQAVGVIIGGDREERRASKRQREKEVSKLGAVDMIRVSEDLSEQKLEGQDPLKVKVVKRGEKGRDIFVDIDPSEIADEFGLKVDNDFKSTVAEMIELLSREPFVSGTKAIGSGAVKVRAPGRNGNGLLKLRRFAPEKCPKKNLSYYKDRKTWRVVYGVDAKNKALVVVDVLSHMDFDKKYV